MICAGFLSTTERAELIELARNGLVEHRLARRANALALLDQGMSCSDVGAALFLDDDTVRTWFRSTVKRELRVWPGSATRAATVI